jgi:hypothetical protein
MTLLETSLSLAFMAMFFAALFAASQGIDRLTRGYTCRILSEDQAATMPERGCSGQVDEVSVDGVGMLKLANQSALRALRDDLVRHSGSLGGFAIPFADVQLPTDSTAPSLVDRRTVLNTRCLWEKISPGRGGRFVVERNFLRISPASMEVVPPERQGLPKPSSVERRDNHYWFIRAGRLIGERDVNGAAQPIEGMQAVDDGFLSVDPISGTIATSLLERTAQPTEIADELVNAPNASWGLINQVCLYQGPSSTSPSNPSLDSLYLLSAERGSDLGSNGPPLFGRDVGVASRQPAPRLLFYAPKP